MSDLQTIIDDIDRHLAELEGELGPMPGPFATSERRDAWWARHNHGIERIKGALSSAHGAKFRLHGSCEHAVRIAGIRSTCTAGLIGALRNWQAAARRRMEKEKGNG